jgi:hypothetical protein
MTKQLIGAELEGFFVDGQGNQVNTIARLGSSSLSTGKEFEVLTCDMAESSFEMVTTPCGSTFEVRESLGRIRGLMPKDLTTVFKTRPFPGKVRVVQKPRAKAMKIALSREHERGNLGIETVAPHCATHYHIGVPSVWDLGAVLLLNVLNHFAPGSRQCVIARFGIEGAEGHLNCWQGWCNPDRVPGPRWFWGTRHLEKFVGKIPKLVKQVGTEWHPCKNEPSRLGDPESEGTLWWLARPRGQYNTIEWRPFPSMEEEMACELVDAIFTLVEAFWKYADENPIVYWSLLREPHQYIEGATAFSRDEFTIDWSSIQRMHEHLAKKSWLVPVDCSFEDSGVSWWKAYRS